MLPSCLHVQCKTLHPLRFCAYYVWTGYKEIFPMTELQFISSIVASLAWPLTLIMVLSLLRDPIFELLPGLKLFQWGDKLKVEFEKKLGRVEAEASKIPDVESAKPHLDNASLERYEWLANSAPNLAILQSWFDVEAALKSTALDMGIEFKRSSPLDTARAIQRAGRIDEQTAELLRDLRVLRNLAVHPDEDRPISVEQARRYKSIADRIIAALRVR